MGSQLVTLPASAQSVKAIGSQTSEREKILQDQIRQMKKHMQYKEHEFDKDKSIWIQKYELSQKELSETRQQLETQKLYYLQIIASLKFSGSPLKQPTMLDMSPSQKKRLDESISFISDQDVIRQSLKIKGNEEKLQ